MAYLVAPPMGATIALDAALKASGAACAKVFTPPTETNFAAAWLTGAQHQCEAYAEENVTISKVAFWSKALGILGFVTGLLGFVNRGYAGVVQIALGYLFLTAGQRFSTVVDTSGNDINNMMAAIRKLGEAFTIKLVILGLAFAMMACMLIAMLVMFISVLAAG